MKNKSPEMPIIMIDPVPTHLDLGIGSNGNRRRRKSWLARQFECRMPREGYNPNPVVDTVMIGLSIIILVICAIALMAM